MSGLAVLEQVLGVAAAVGGVGLLRVAWRRPKPAALTVAGWTLLVAAVPGWALGTGWDKAWALALLTPSLVAFGLIGLGAEVRAGKRGRPQKRVTELADQSDEAAWRALVRTVYGGPLSGSMALLVSAAWALKGAGSQADRIACALFAAPALWALGLIWATTDSKLLRIGGGLGALALAGGLAAVL